LREAPERVDAAVLSFGAQRAQLFQGACMARGHSIPSLLQAIPELDHGSQNLVTFEQLLELPVIAFVEKRWVSKEQVQGASRELIRASPPGELPKHRPYHSAAVVTQHVEPIREQCLHGVSIDSGAAACDGRRWRQAADARETERAK
jgi:hypothetical protein